jgi:hypothetical protein
MSTIRADSVTSVTKLNGSNYKTWSVQIRLLLEQGHVWRMVGDRRPAELTDTSSTEHQEWEMKEETARSKILLSLEERLQMKYASETDNAAEIWQKLRDDNKSKVKLNVWGIRADLYRTRLGDEKGDSIEKYAAWIQQLVDDYDLVADEDDGKMSKSEHTYYLIRGLPATKDWEIFVQMQLDKSGADNVMAKPDDLVTKMLAREAKLEHDKVDSTDTALFGGTAGKKSKGPGHGKKGDKSKGDKSQVTCYECGGKGHIKAKCPTLAASGSSGGSSNQKQLVVREKEAAKGYSAAFSAIMIGGLDELMEPCVDEAGLQASGATDSSVRVNSEDWHVDSGASTHISGNKRYFLNYKPYANGKLARRLRGFKGAIVTADGYGDVVLNFRIPGGTVRTANVTSR